MSNILAIKPNERERLNRKLKSFGLSIEGGSVDYDSEMAWISIKRNVATYNYQAIAILLGGDLGVTKVVLDGCPYAIPA